MDEFFYRTEDISAGEILNYFVETAQDRAIVEALKARNPVVLVGSRGVGKSFLLRVAEAELLAGLQNTKVFPVYVTFNKSALLSTPDAAQFQHWMLARMCTRIVRSLRSAGILSVAPPSLSILSGGAESSSGTLKIEAIADAYEASWQHPGHVIDLSGLPSIEKFKDAMEDLCGAMGLKRFAIFIDEAAHIFLPDQQRQFFTLFRDLRSPQITCNAAVYPGVTSFGETFQLAHDATRMDVNRDVLADNYISSMRDIVEKQADSVTISNIARNGQNFALLAYAASGNPRVLLKTLAKAPNVNSQQVNEVIREYYRGDMWAEHSGLVDKYVGHGRMIDWGRTFIENEVLPELQKKNRQYLTAGDKSTSFFWVHRDAPASVKEALRLLAYTGVVAEGDTGIKATRSEIGTRYSVNLGCLFALEQTPTATAYEIAKNLTPKRMSEYGANHEAFRELLANVPDFTQADLSEALARQLAKSVSVLDITQWQKDKLRSIGLNTIGDVLRADEAVLQTIYYVAEKRSRRMRNAALAAVYEYLSG
jgi:hypothetical protein